MHLHLKWATLSSSFELGDIVIFIDNVFLNWE